MEELLKEKNICIFVGDDKSSTLVSHCEEENSHYNIEELEDLEDDDDFYTEESYFFICISVIVLFLIIFCCLLIILFIG